MTAHEVNCIIAIVGMISWIVGLVYGIVDHYIMYKKHGDFLNKKK